MVESMLIKVRVTSNAKEARVSRTGETSFEVKVDEKEVSLTAKEFGLLEQLLRNRGRVLTRDVLLNTVWGYDYHGTTRTVDVHIRRLKQKAPLLNEAIVSVKSLGYKLRDHEEK